MSILPFVFLPSEEFNQKMTFQPAFNARLISEVKKFPCLYNHSKRGSGDTMERQRIWEVIAAAVDPNCSGDFAKKRWLQLRDRYRKELKTAIRQGFTTPIRWCYFSHLSWLDPYLKDNLMLTHENIADPIENHFFSFDLSSLSNVKDDIDEGIEDLDNSSESGPSILDRLLASTHRQSASPELENDDSGPQSVETLGGDLDRNESSGSATATESISNAERDQTDKRSLTSEKDLASHLIQSIQAHANFSIRDQILARQMLQAQQSKSFSQITKTAIDWINDEDMLYSRIISLRLKRLDPKKRKRVRAQIMSLLDDSDIDDDDTVSSKSARLESEMAADSKGIDEL